MESKSINKDDHNGKATAPPMQQGDINQGQYELILNWYRINSRQLIGEEVLDGLQINTLLKTLGNPIWNNLYHCWAIENKHMSELQRFVKHDFNPDVFLYLLKLSIPDKSAFSTLAVFSAVILIHSV